MSAPLIWIGTPLIMAFLIGILHLRGSRAVALSGGYCLFLAFLAMVLPIDTALKFGTFTIEVVSSFEILGRRFLLDSGDLSLLVLLYTIGALWFLGAGVVKTPRYFLSISMAILAISVAALAVEPFLYAALLIEVVVLLSIPILAPFNSTVGQGILRYLIFQTLALPFILFAGWSAAGVQANPADQHLLQQTLALLGLGFAFWLGVFPFYTWIPLLTGESHPYVAAFILNLLPTVILLQMLLFFNEFGWLWTNPQVPQVLRLMGTIMVITGGFWAIFQKDLAHLFGYAVILENGFSLLALSLVNSTGLELFASSLLPRIIALGVAALALSCFPENISLTLSGVRGLLRRFPVASSALLISLFSLGGIPLLAGFPVRQVLLENLAQKSLGITIWVLVGNIGFLVGVFRSAATFLLPVQQEETVDEGERIGPIILLSIGSISLFLIGLFPRLFLSGMLGLLKAFSHIY